MKLIPLDSVLAEINKRLEMLVPYSQFDKGGMIELQVIKDKLNSLKVKEVDIEKELSTYLEVVKATDEDIDFVDFAKHFFELGLKAQKGELEYIKYQLELRLPETLDYNGVQVDREDFINDFIKAMKDE